MVKSLNELKVTANDFANRSEQAGLRLNVEKQKYLLTEDPKRGIQIEGKLSENLNKQNTLAK